MLASDVIPGKIVRFLEQHANVGFAGTRDRDLVPSGCRVSAWHVQPDGHTMTLFIPNPLVDRVIAALEDNGQIAVTIEENGTHETYQLKGQYVRHRAVEADDLPLVARFRERFLRSIRHEIPPGVPEEFVGAFAVPDPAVVVDADIREVYLQTPGPGAGGRIYPPPDAVERPASGVSAT
jgi:hypothetical protein